MTKNPDDRLRVPLVVATVLLVIVSLGSTAYYLSTSATIDAKDAEILRLRAVALTENLTILKQELTMLELNSTLPGLNQSLMRVQNQSAFLRLELSVAEQEGGFTVVPYFANMTFGADPGTSIRLTAQSNGRNGTLVFLSPLGCPISGENLTTTGSQSSLYIWMSSGFAPAQSAYYSMNANPFTVFLENKGTSPVSCVVSLLYVRR